MKNRKARIATAITVLGLGGLTGVALSAGGQKASTLADKPLVRTKVIHRTVRVTKHLEPKHPIAGGNAPGSGARGGSQYGATTGASSTGSGSYSSSPVSTGASATGGAATPVSTGPSGTGGGGGSGEVDPEGEGGDD